MTWERKRLILAFLVPLSFLYLIFFLIPAIQSLYYSIFDWRGFGTEKEFIGLRNFQHLLDLRASFDSQFPFLHLNPRDSVFWLSMRTTLMYSLLGGVLTFVLAFLLTAMLSSGIRGRKLFRLIIFAPNVVAAVALATLWGFIYNPRFGMLKGFFDILGLEGLAKTTWMGPGKIVFSVLIAMCWIWVGFYLVMLLAGVDQIPQELFDAAKVDGANFLQIFTKVTIPLVWDVLSIAIIHFSIGALKVFEFPYVICGRLPPQEIWTLGIYTYVMGFGKRDPIYRLGYASAIGVIMQLMVIALILIFSRIFRREAIEY
jgi:ABC-type sugar transport system permease subunit